MKNLILSTLLLLSFATFASDIFDIATCKVATDFGVQNVEIKKIGDGIGINLISKYGDYFYLELGEYAAIEASDDKFKIIATSDSYTYLTIDFNSGRGRVLQRLLPAFHNCLMGGNPSACIVFNTRLYSCKNQGYTSALLMDN